MVFPKKTINIYRFQQCLWTQGSGEFLGGKSSDVALTISSAGAGELMGKERLEDVTIVLRAAD